MTEIINEESDPRIQGFADLARQYCSWAESEPGDAHVEMEFAQTILAELNLALLRLPNMTLPDGDSGDAKPPDNGKFVHSRFFHLPIQGYWDVFDPLNEEAPVLNTLPDDLADIYANLMDGIFLFERGDIPGAIWEWRFQYIIHWGAHLTGAQRAIYAYFAKHDDRFV